jgi:hypothetical protein
MKFGGETSLSMFFFSENVTLLDPERKKETNMLLVMNHNDIGFWLSRGLALKCVRPDLTTPPIHHKADDISNCDLRDLGGRTHTHTDILTGSLYYWSYSAL